MARPIILASARGELKTCPSKDSLCTPLVIVKTPPLPLRSGSSSFSNWEKSATSSPNILSIKLFLNSDLRTLLMVWAIGMSSLPENSGDVSKSSPAISTSSENK